MTKPKLTAERLRELLDYDPITGLFTWRRRRGKGLKGSVAGSRDDLGYVKIGIDNWDYRGHRLAWLHYYGKWPADMLDHIDGDPENNAIANLREVDTTTNQQNQRRAHADSKHGVMGASKHGDKWFARITVNKVFHHLGVFDTAEAAHAAYLDAKRRLHAACTI